MRTPKRRIVAFVSIVTVRHGYYIGSAESFWHPKKKVRDADILSLVLHHEHVASHEVSTAKVLYRSDRDSDELLALLEEMHGAYSRRDELSEDAGRAYG
jgi:hypothetical protein